MPIFRVTQNSRKRYPKPLDLTGVNGLRHNGGMPSKSQIDSETKTPKGDESYLERYNRVRKRIAWGLDINEEEKEF